MIWYGFTNATLAKWKENSKITEILHSYSLVFPFLFSRDTKGVEYGERKRKEKEK